jgi:pimeloyl-ACP methyl ester carboxylesterase
MRQRLTRLGTLLVLLAVAAGGTGVAHAQEQQSAGPACRDVAVPVSIDGGSSTPYHVYGSYCEPAGGSRVLQILVPGMTYGHQYWDADGFDQAYSYAAFMNRIGYATLTIDRVGTGRSSYVPGLLNGSQAQVESLHDVIQAARHGDVLGHTYPSVVVAGHSYGTAVVYLEAARYHDADGLIATGLTNTPSAIAYADFVAHTQPATQDPRLRRQVGTDPLYITTQPSSRAHLFFPPGTDPRILQYDETIKNVDTLTEFATPFSFVAETRLIDAPVLLAVGEKDYFMCAQGGALAAADCSDAAALRDSQLVFFGPAAQLETYVLPGAAHSINFAPDTARWYAAAASWLNARFPPR